MSRAVRRVGRIVIATRTILRFFVMWRGVMMHRARGVRLEGERHAQGPEQRVGGEADGDEQAFRHARSIAYFFLDADRSYPCASE